MHSKIIFSLALPFLLFISCQNQPDLKIAETVFTDLKKDYAPDKRVATFDFKFNQKGGKLVLEGTTNLPKAKKELIQKLTEEGFEIEDKSILYPTATLGKKTYGIVNVSVCNIRSKKGHSQELTTQALLGTPIKILDKIDNWFLIQTPDKYIAWLDEGGFVLVDEMGYKDWISRPKTVYIKDFGFSYEEPNRNAQKVSDLVAGDILKSIGLEKGFVKVEYPDERNGFIPEKDVVNYDTWLASREPSPTNILATAQEYLGRPYLWGGTSGKGMDCSGFTKTVFFLNGIQLARDASQQVHTGIAVETDSTLTNLQAGDLLFFGRTATKDKKERITHVSIYMGKGLMIHSSGDAGIKIESLIRGAEQFNEKRLHSFVRAKRMLNSLGENGVELLAELGAYNASEL